MVVTANHMRDRHVDVVHHNAEVVGRCAIGARDHQIVEFGVADFNAAFDLIVPSHHAVFRIFKAQHRLHTSGDGWQVFTRLRTPCAVVARFFFGGHLFLAQSVEFGHAHVTRVHMPTGLQLRQHLLVAVHALHLIERAFVVIEAQPLHAFDDDVHRFLRRTLQVGVFDAQNELTTVGPRKRPGVKRRADVAQVNEARR